MKGLEYNTMTTRMNPADAGQPLAQTDKELMLMHLNDKIMVDTANLMLLLDCGKHTAIKLGHQANACVRLERKLFWNVRRIKEYIDNITA